MKCIAFQVCDNRKVLDIERESKQSSVSGNTVSHFMAFLALANLGFLKLKHIHKSNRFDDNKYPC